MQIRLKQGGEGLLGDWILPPQQDFLDRVAQYRREQKPVQWINLKPRQYVSMTTISGSVLVGDNHTNAGFNAFVTSNTRDSLQEIDQIFKYFYGKTKQQAIKDGRATRFADYLYTAKNGSRITAQMGTENLGRSGAVTGFLMSEAGYITDWTETWRSIEPSLTPAWWRYVIMETTLRRNQPGDFRDIIEEASENKYPPWEVWFTGWWANPRLIEKATRREMAEFKETAPDYEMELVAKHGLTWEQALWYYRKRIGGMFGSYDAMFEAYPTTKEEALRSVTATDYFHREALKFYNDNVREPIKRMKPRPSGLRDYETGDSLLQPHLEIWELPMSGGNYIMGADCADNKERIAVEGSENALVIANQDTGHIVAVYHGYATAHEFADVIDMVGRMYNEAYGVIEWNNAGRAVIDRLRERHLYTNLYRREQFKYGVAINQMQGIYGFDTRGHTRGIMLDRLQLGVNRRLWDIPSKYVLDCIKVLGKNNGEPAHRRPGSKPDDGAIATALTAFGHDNVVEELWKPKQPWEPELLMLDEPRRTSSWGKVVQDTASKRTWDPVWGKWR